MGIIAAAVPLLIILLLLFDKWGKSLLPHPQFTIRDLLLSTALIAAGISALLLPFRVSEELLNTPVLIPLFAGLMIAGCPLIGAGLFLPFGKTRIGVIWGILAMLVLACLLPASPHP